MPYFFKLPKITELTTSQQAALNEPNPIAISGGPGTGKSVVSLWRHIRNYATGTKKSLLLTYTKTLEVYLAESARSQNNNAGNSVDRTYWWTTHKVERYDEIIVDEAQDVEEKRYEIIKNHSRIVSYGADDQQILFKEQATTQSQLESIFPENSIHVLDENFRNSYEIMHFVRGLFPNKIISQAILEDLLKKNRKGEKPTVLVSSNEEKRNNFIFDIINTL